MGRAGLVIDRKELAETLTELEANAKFSNRSQLYDAVTNTLWAEGIKDTLGRSKKLSVANVYQYVTKFGLDKNLVTPQGKRGNPNIGAKLTPEQREKRISQRPGFLKTINRLKADIFTHFGQMPDSKLRLLEKAAKGNVRASVKLKCLECCCWQASEAAKCTVYGCPLYLINPYLKSQGEAPETDEVKDEE